MSKAEAMAVYSYRTRMAIYSDNYKGQGDVITCPLCHLHFQKLSFQCPEVKKNIQIGGKYEKIFDAKISSELAKTVLHISKLRKEYMEGRQIEK